MSNKNYNKISGFTLLELLVTIAVIVILATVGVPAFRTTIANSRIESTSNALRNSLVTARNKAIETASRVEVSPGNVGDWNSWKVGSGQLQFALGATVVTGKTSGNSNIVDVTFTEDGSLGEETLEFQVFSVCYTGSVDSIKPKAVVISPGGLILIKDEVQLVDLSISCPES
ncbi:MAG: prepilin-type N-terminal cleavage/methylation domain-containing protein [Gammaproteobacteria bacterium]|nr:MAG: prepilin-type N-terminal cleavage/methylation domain-containing protein [Gammaproteobacteria bacterium]